MGGGKGGGKQCYTTGYRYYAGLHLVFCHALDALLRIKVGDKSAWDGSVGSNTAISINQPDLHGGEDREGGIVGTVDACFGGPGQAQNGYLQSILGGTIPAYRGLFGLVARKCMLAANNPYIKEWSILGRRTLTGWRDDLAGITAPDGHADMNPAHIIRETLTNTTWGGMGYPVADLDDASFQTAANLLHAEGFGLSLLWAKNTSVEDFLRIILDHIDGVLYYSHVTGLLKLKLVRNDYNIGGLQILNESNIIDLVEYHGPTAVEAINQVTINWVDRDNQPQAVTVHDLAGFARTNGQVNPTTLYFPGVASASLAAGVASRALQQLGMPISSVTLNINRTHSQLEPGDCFNFSWTPLGIENMAMRISGIEIGEHTDGQLRVTAVRDVYGLGAISLTTPETSMWTNPISVPSAAINRKVEELTWWQFVRIFGESEAVLVELDNTSTLVSCFCGRPSSDALNYEMWDRNSGAPDWTRCDTDSFPLVALLAAAVVPEISTTLALATTIDPYLVAVGSYAALENELVAITAIDTVANTLTVDRGVLDTIPVAHAAGSVLWCHQDAFGLDSAERAAGEVVEVRILPATSKGRLELAAAPTNTITTVGRMMRPYPPGNVRVNGSRWPVSIGAATELTVTWAHRDRRLQTVTLNRQDEGNIGPEAGTTYTLRIYGETATLLRTVTGLAVTTYTYLSATEQADNGLGRLSTSLRFELESMRDGLVSFSMWNLSVGRV